MRESSNPYSVLSESSHPLHGPSFDRIACAQVYANIINHALNSSDPPSVVIQNCIAGVPPQILALLPSFDSLVQSVRYKRRKSNHHPVNPMSAHDFDIPAQD